MTHLTWSLCGHLYSLLTSWPICSIELCQRGIGDNGSLGEKRLHYLRKLFSYNSLKVWVFAVLAMLLKSATTARWCSWIDVGLRLQWWLVQVLACYGECGSGSTANVISATLNEIWWKFYSFQTVRCRVGPTLLSVMAVLVNGVAFHMTPRMLMHSCYSKLWEMWQPARYRNLPDISSSVDAVDTNLANSHHVLYQLLAPEKTRSV